MMQLLSAWKESILLFKPSNFKLFLLVTLKSFIDTLKVWFRYWWWLIGVVLVAPYLICGLLDYTFPLTGQWLVGYETIFFMRQGFWAIFVGTSFSRDALLISPETAFMIRMVVGVSVTCLLSLLYTSLYLSVRPSVAIKNWGYFKNYGKHALYIFAWFLLLPQTFIITDYVFGLASWPLVIILAGISFVIISSISLLYITFLLDSDASLKQVALSVLRAIKMTVYNLPFFILTLLMFFILYLIVLAPGILLNPIEILGGSLVTFQRWFYILYIAKDIFIILLLACFFVNYYIKKIHDNYSLYFGSK
ncbi:MAG: hypothetical protein ACHQVS_03845 [Candidatus Babeliales bacterium]